LSGSFNGRIGGKSYHSPDFAMTKAMVIARSKAKLAFLGR